MQNPTHQCLDAASHKWTHVTVSCERAFPRCFLYHSSVKDLIAGECDNDKAQISVGSSRSWSACRFFPQHKRSIPSGLCASSLGYQVRTSNPRDYFAFMRREVDKAANMRAD